MVLEDTTGFIKQIKLRGKELFVWTVDDEKDMKRLLLYGVNAILSNDPLKCINVRRRLSRNRANRAFKAQY